MTRSTPDRTRSARSLRRVALVLALALDLVGAVALTAPPAPLTLHPLAPPLTRIAALGDHPLGDHLAPAEPGAQAPGRTTLARAVHHVIQQIGTREQRARLTTLLPPRAPGGRSATLQRAIEADAMAIAAVLGDDRVAAIVAHKEELAERYGEGRIWVLAHQRLAP